MSASTETTTGAEDFKVEAIDHIHVYVADQRAAAAWHRRVLGLEIVKEFEDWATDGPLTISSDGGRTSLALFNAAPETLQSARRQTIAFRVGGAGFIAFLKRLDTLEVTGAYVRPLRSGDVVDHKHSFSVYFSDPDGNPYELTSYDYDFIRERLGVNDGEN
jgi:catechol 2,3-dioxygenase-like lactoylglutathione lyase family enzyme